MENEWSYKSLEVEVGLKPGSKHFQCRKKWTSTRWIIS